MTKAEFDRKQDELNRLLNDPRTPMRPDRVWALAEALATWRPHLETEPARQGV